MAWGIRKTLGQVLEATAIKYPLNIAVKDPEHCYTYRELNRLSDDMAKGFLAMGIRKGTHVGIFAGNTATNVCTFFALWKIGAVVCPICTTYSRYEVEHCIECADITHMITGMASDGHCEDLCSNFKHQVRLISQREFDEYTKKGSSMSDIELNGYKLQVTCDDDDTILFSSGTTGKSKPVLTSHFNRVTTAHFQAKTLKATARDRYVAVLPMYHCFSITAIVLAAVSVGAMICIPADKHARTILQMIEDEGCTILTAVPTLYASILRRYEEGDYDVSTLRTGMIGGAPYFPEFFRELCEKLDFTLLPSLGATEATAGITAGKLNDSLELRSTSLGKPFPHVLCKVVDPATGEELPIGEKGELCVKGYNIMRGYYKMPEATANSFIDGCWFRTGDLVRKDENGVLYYLGRLKELIIRGGENIIPREVEDMIAQDERVSQVKVIGVPDPHYGEEVCAVIVKAVDAAENSDADGKDADAVTPADITDEEVREIVRSQAANFKVPKYVIFLKEFPLNNVGKTDIKGMKEMARKTLALDRHRDIKL